MLLVISHEKKSPRDQPDKTHLVYCLGIQRPVPISSTTLYSTTSSVDCDGFFKRGKASSAYSFTYLYLYLLLALNNSNNIHLLQWKQKSFLPDVSLIILQTEIKTYRMQKPSMTWKAMYLLSRILNVLQDKRIATSHEISIWELWMSLLSA